MKVHYSFVHGSSPALGWLGSHLKQFSKYLFIGAGTGLTPLLQTITIALNNPGDTTQLVFMCVVSTALACFAAPGAHTVFVCVCVCVRAHTPRGCSFQNRSEDDIIMRKELEKLAAQEERLTLGLFLSRAPSGWAARRPGI